MRAAIIDAQGAGLGQTIIKRIHKELGSDIYLIALGTNNAATLNMLKAGANRGITGESDISYFCRTEAVDCIIGPIGILVSGGINGEITSSISNSIIQKDCTKYIIPLQKHGIFIPGTRQLSIKCILTEIIEDMKLKMK